MPEAHKFALTVPMLSAFAVGSCPQAGAQDGVSVTVFENDRVFDGKSTSLSAASNALIRGNIIECISSTPIAVDRSADTRIVSGGGHVLIPGLTDVHWHSMKVRPTPAQILSSDLTRACFSSRPAHAATTHTTPIASAKNSQ